jgi:hypothetical protein
MHENTFYKTRCIGDRSVDMARARGMCVPGRHVGIAGRPVKIDRGGTSSENGGSWHQMY